MKSAQQLPWRWTWRAISTSTPTGAARALERVRDCIKSARDNAGHIYCNLVKFLITNLN